MEISARVCYSSLTPTVVETSVLWCEGFLTFQNESTGTVTLLDPSWVASLGELGVMVIEAANLITADLQPDLQPEVRRPRRSHCKRFTASPPDPICYLCHLGGKL